MAYAVETCMENRPRTIDEFGEEMFINQHHFSSSMPETIQLPKAEYQDMLEYMERMRETIEFISNKTLVKKLVSALKRIESGSFLTKQDMVF